MVLNPEGRARFQQHLQITLRQPFGMRYRQLAGRGCGLRTREFTAAADGEFCQKPVLAMTCNGCGHVVCRSTLKTGIISFPQQGQPQVAAPVAEEITDDEVI